MGQLAVLCCIELVGGSSKRKQVCVLLLLRFLLLLQASCYFRRKSDQWKVPTTTNLTGLETRKMHGFDECEMQTSSACMREHKMEGRGVSNITTGEKSRKP